MNKYTIIIGLEIHIEPNTNSKMFCSCPQDHFGAKPNSQTCPICLGLPGALPIANKEAINKVIKLGLALGSRISAKSNFYRKHYFYPDLAKSFQTSQKDNPFCIGGELLGKKINHIHLEEDAGKLVHLPAGEAGQDSYSLIDFNRCGCALIEMVTEPVFHSVEDVISFTKELQLIARYLDISNSDMEKGTMRLEANISLQPITHNPQPVFNLPDYKVELKNINSFKFLEKALNAEIERQTLSLDNGEKLVQETRGYDENTKKTFSQRVKADSHDYRYFPEADLPPVNTSDKDIKILSEQLIELPAEKRKRFEEEYKLSKEYIEILVSDLNRANYFEECTKLAPDLAKSIANLIVNKNLDREFPEPAGLVRKIRELEDKSYESEENTESAVEQILKDNLDIVNQYKNGKGQVIGFLIGKVQKVLNGKGDPKLISAKLIQQLNAN